MADRTDRPAVVLLSGGLDSATTLAWAIARGHRAHALTVDYGQRHGIEIERARILAAALGAASHRIARVELPSATGSSLTDPTTSVPAGRTSHEIGRGIPSTYVPARNTLLLALALGLAETLGARDLFIGANAIDYSGYPDCRPGFLADFARVCRSGTRAGAEGEEFAIQAPLLSWSKAEIIHEALRLGVDVASTISCYDPDPGGRPCGVCDACVLRAKGFREAGVPDPALDPARAET
jgi:7-cyano-7-deazaguanine synthase